MGKTGTDVAKSAADMVLADDNFITIVGAIKEGRNIFVNIQKAIHFLLSSNVGEIVTIFVGLLLGLDTPLLAIHLLWINLVTDSFPAIALGVEPQDKNIMDKKPRDPKKGIFADGLWTRILMEGVMVGILTLLAFNIGNSIFSLEVGRTMAFLTLGLAELAHSFNIKSEGSVFNRSIFNNKYLIGAFVMGAILQISVVTIPAVADIFKVTALNTEQWVYTILISLAPIPIIELQKKFNEIVYGKRVYELNGTKSARKTEEKQGNEPK